MTNVEWDLHLLWENANRAYSIPANHKRMKEPWKNKKVHAETRKRYIERMKKYESKFTAKKELFILHEKGHLSLEQYVNICGSIGY